MDFSRARPSPKPALLLERTENSVRIVGSAWVLHPRSLHPGSDTSWVIGGQPVHHDLFHASKFLVWKPRIKKVPTY